MNLRIDLPHWSKVAPQLLTPLYFWVMNEYVQSTYFPGGPAIYSLQGIGPP